MRNPSRVTRPLVLLVVFGALVLMLAYAPGAIAAGADAAVIPQVLRRAIPQVMPRRSPKRPRTKARTG